MIVFLDIGPWNRGRNCFVVGPWWGFLDVSSGRVLELLKALSSLIDEVVASSKMRFHGCFFFGAKIFSLC